MIEKGRKKKEKKRQKKAHDVSRRCETVAVNTEHFSEFFLTVRIAQALCAHGHPLRRTHQLCPQRSPTSSSRAQATSHPPVSTAAAVGIWPTRCPNTGQVRNRRRRHAASAMHKPELD